MAGKVIIQQAIKQVVKVFKTAFSSSAQIASFFKQSVIKYLNPSRIINFIFGSLMNSRFG